jgi:hypothetical protein
MSKEIIRRLLATLIGALKTQPFEGSLWIVEEARIRAALEE